MARFTRPARWLKTIFPPSQAPGIIQPSAVSDDVQLVHGYQLAQDQAPADYYNEYAVLNPGQNANATLINIPGTDDEAWRITCATIESPLGPAANFDYQVGYLDNMTAPGRFVAFDTAETIAAGSTVPRVVASPYALAPFIIARQGTRATFIGMRQTSAQAALTEAFTVRAWSFKAPWGGSLNF